MMNLFGMAKPTVTLLVAIAMVFGLTATSHAQTLGPGIGILDLPGPDIQVDTPSDGTTDQSRQNLDQSFTATLGAGEYHGNQLVVPCRADR